MTQNFTIFVPADFETEKIVVYFKCLHISLLATNLLLATEAKRESFKFFMRIEVFRYVSTFRIINLHIPPAGARFKGFLLSLSAKVLDFVFNTHSR